MQKSNPAFQAPEPPAIELGEEMVVSDEELDRIYGTDVPLTSPSSLMYAEDFLENDSDVIDTVPDWLYDASNGDRFPTQKHRSGTLLGSLIVVGLIVLGSVGLTFSDSFSVLWTPDQSIAAKQ